MLMSFGVQTSENLTYTEAAIFIEILEDKAVALNRWKKQSKKELKQDIGPVTFFKSKDNLPYPSQLNTTMSQPLSVQTGLMQEFIN